MRNKVLSEGKTRRKSKAHVETALRLQAVSSEYCLVSLPIHVALFTHVHRPASRTSHVPVDRPIRWSVSLQMFTFMLIWLK